MSSNRPKVLLLETQSRHLHGSMARYARMVEVALGGDRGSEIHIIRLNIAPSSMLSSWLPGGIATWLSHLWQWLTGPARVRRSRPDLVHLLDGSHGYLLPRLRGLPVVTTVHDLIPKLQEEGHFGQGRGSWAARRLIQQSLNGLRQSEILLAVSSCTAEDVMRLAGIDPVRLTVAPLALEAVFNAGRAGDLADSDWSSRAAQPVVLHVGNNGYYKNRRGVLRIFSRMRERCDARLVMAGSPPDMALLACIDELSLQGHVQFMAEVSDAELAELYGQASVLLFPSLYEGFGWPPLEAMACGCPVVCSSEGSLAEVVGDAALVRPAADEAGLAALCVEVLEDPALAQSLREKGRIRCARYSLERMRNDLVGAYERVLAGKLQPTGIGMTAGDPR